MVNIDAMKKPILVNWGKINKEDLDACWAFEQFAGKSLDEAEALFQVNALYYQEALSSMPATAFNFYVKAFVNYITSERACGDADGASSFLHMVVWMLKENRNIIANDTQHLLVRTAEYVANHQWFYEASKDIYGVFPDLYAEILTLTN